jgi:hypothetical protein
MALSDADRIDVVARGPSGEIVLGIVANEPWGDGERAAEQLTGKLGTYLSFITGEEYQTKFGSAPASVRLLTVEQPPELIRRFIEAASAAFGVEVEVELVAAAGALGEGHKAVSELKSTSLGGPSAEARVKRIRNVFGVLAFVAGVLGAVYAYRLSGSIALAIYVFLFTNYVVSRGVADVITDPYKIRRILYFALQPALSTGVLYVVYRLWGRMWLAVILGIILGVILHGLLAPRLFPRIHIEEGLDSAQRMKEMKEMREQLKRQMEA